MVLETLPALRLVKGIMAAMDFLLTLQVLAGEELALLEVTQQDKLLVLVVVDRLQRLRESQYPIAVVEAVEQVDLGELVEPEVRVAAALALRVIVLLQLQQEQPTEAVVAAAVVVLQQKTLVLLAVQASLLLN